MFICHLFQYSIQVNHIDEEKGKKTISGQEIATHFWKKISR